VTDELSIEQMVQRHMLSTIEAMGLMLSKHLYGHYLVVVYSTIDALGLLDAPAVQMSSSSNSFKAWVAKYLLPNLQPKCTELEIWAARCAVLHTFTTESDLSREGKARELQYFLADGEAAREFSSMTSQIDGGAHVAVHLLALGKAFVTGMQQFVPALLTNCNSSLPHANRLRNVLQNYPMEPPP